MQFAIALDAAHNTVSLELSGACSVADIPALFDEIIKVDGRSGLRVLADLREINLIDPSFFGIMDVALAAGGFIGKYAPVRHAVIVSEATFGPARMFEQLAKTSGYEVSIFSNAEEAREWLGL